MNRRPLVVGNWKMELSHKAEVEVVRSLKTLLKNKTAQTDVVICPSYPSLAIAAELIKNSDKLQLGAQGVHWEEKGAWTGQVSVLQVSHFVQWCIVGHSEQRALYAINDDMVQRQVDLCLKYGLTPIMCVGETAEERDQEKTIDKITQQLHSLLAKTPRSAFSKLVLAYEPIWAIGTGERPDPNDVAGVMLFMRKLIAERFDVATSERVRILYGGSVTAESVGPYVAEPGIDGVLVGGASVHPSEFVEIINSVDSHAS